MKNPPMMGYVRQANIAHGHQQVNNAPSIAGDTSRTRENADLQSKLLEENYGERLDIGEAGAADGANPEMAPREKSTGPKTPEGKAKVAQNAYKGGTWRVLRELARAMRDQRKHLPL